MELNFDNHIAVENLIHVHAASNELPQFPALQISLQEKKFQLLVKRTFDVVVALLLIILFFPILLLISLLIKLTSKGPVLYSRERIGLNGRLFKCHKFRSMVRDHSINRHKHLSNIGYTKNGILHKSRADERITLIGKIIRKTSMDELPQLFNVLAGDMSLVGPRPLVPFMLMPYPEFMQMRSLVRPGITGLWQIRARENNTSAEFMMQHDIEYIHNLNLLLDLKIFAVTPLVVLSGKGAY